MTLTTEAILDAFTHIPEIPQTNLYYDSETESCCGLTAIVLANCDDPDLFRKDLTEADPDMQKLYLYQEMIEIMPELSCEELDIFIFGWDDLLGIEGPITKNPMYAAACSARKELCDLSDPE